MFIKALVFILAISIMGCSSIDKEMSIDHTKNKSFALTVVDYDDLFPMTGLMLKFQKIDIKTRAFLPEKFEIEYSILSPLDGDELERPSHLREIARYAGKTIDSGDYILISESYYFPDRTSVICYANGAPVFKIIPGAINILPINAALNGKNDQIKRDVDLVMKNYPNMNISVSFAETLGVATLETRKGLWGNKTCLGLKISSFTHD
jgi:hypothetical protein